MFERFTREARLVAVLAQHEARELGHPRIGTGHLLLGLLALNNGIALRLLREQGVDAERVRAFLTATGAAEPPRRLGRWHRPFTKSARTALREALNVAVEARHRFIGTGHVLAGVLNVADGTARRVLTDSGADADTLRARARAEAAEERP